MSKPVTQGTHFTNIRGDRFEVIAVGLIEYINCHGFQRTISEEEFRLTMTPLPAPPFGEEGEPRHTVERIKEMRRAHKKPPSLDPGRQRYKGFWCTECFTHSGCGGKCRSGPIGGPPCPGTFKAPEGEQPQGEYANLVDHHPGHRVPVEQETSGNENHEIQTHDCTRPSRTCGDGGMPTDAEPHRGDCERPGQWDRGVPQPLDDSEGEAASLPRSPSPTTGDPDHA